MIHPFPKPANGYEAVRQAKTWEKAQAIAAELRKGGEYKAFINQELPFKIWKENYDEKDQFIGETFYTLDLTGEKPSCSCPDYEKHGDYCKHVWAIEIALDTEAQEETQEKQLALMDAEMRGCEDSQFGCDPFARF